MDIVVHHGDRGLVRALDKGRVLGVFHLACFEDERALRVGRPFHVDEWENILVTSGLTELGKLLTGTGAPTAYNNASAKLAVGDSSAAPAVGQTDLQAAVNKTYKAMDGGFPSTPTNGVYTWRSTFASGDANYDWREFAVCNGSPGQMLNRSISTQGTKASGQSWQLTYTITLS